LVAKRKEETVSGEQAWEKAGQRMTQEEYAELHALKEKLKSGVKLSFAEENRLFNLEKKTSTITRVL